MNTSYWAFDEALVRGIQSSFADRGQPLACVVDASPVPSADPMIVASVGFGAEGVRGSVTALASCEVARALRPPECGEEEDQEFDCDVVAELSNTLVGRMKNQLLGLGVSLGVGTPLVAIGHDVRVHSRAESAVSAWHTMQVGRAEQLFVRLDVSFEPGFVLRAKPGVVESVGPEGTMLLF